MKRGLSQPYNLPEDWLQFSGSNLPVQEVRTETSVLGSGLAAAAPQGQAPLGRTPALPGSLVLLSHHLLSAQQ